VEAVELEQGAKRRVRRRVWVAGEQRRLLAKPGHERVKHPLGNACRRGAPPAGGRGGGLGRDQHVADKAEQLARRGAV